MNDEYLLTMHDKGIVKSTKICNKLKRWRRVRAENVIKCENCGHWSESHAHQQLLEPGMKTEPDDTLRG